MNVPGIVYGRDQSGILTEELVGYIRRGVEGRVSNLEYCILRGGKSRATTVAHSIQGLLEKLWRPKRRRTFLAA